MRRLGQHFLRSAATVEKIAAAVSPGRRETIIEIGGGHGELTAPLLKLAQKSGADFMVVEKDPQLAEELRRRFPNLRVTEGDVRKKLGETVEELPAEKKFKLAGNLPYYLTGFLLRLISELERKPASCVFMIQKEVAERIVARPPRMNKLAASVQFWAEPEILFTVPREFFSPPPKVDSAVIKLTAKKTAGGEKSYFRLVRTVFAQPRQTVLNNLTRGLKSASKSEFLAAMRKAGLEPDARPQNVSVGQIVLLGQDIGG